jgi:hypothetical protein
VEEERVLVSGHDQRAIEPISKPEFENTPQEAYMGLDDADTVVNHPFTIN